MSHKNVNTVSHHHHPHPQKDNHEHKIERRKSARSISTLNSDKSPGGHGIADMKTLMNTSVLTQKQKKEISWTNILQGNNKTSVVETPQPILFSDLSKRGKTLTSPELAFAKKFTGPTFKDNPLHELARKPGHVPVLKFFHVESHRDREDSEDDGLDDDDLTASDGIFRRPKVVEPRASRRRSYIYEAIKMTKGEFTFNHRTYRPKVQIAYRVPPGELPQAVVIERLHRLYKRTDINVVCQSLGIELSDLIPPPHYGETNERFYQESMFRNRTRVSGQDKREFIRSGGRAAQDLEAYDHFKDRPNSSDSESEDSESERNSEAGEEEEQEEQSQHPFAKSKPPFGAQFLLDYFDDEEFDIRSGEDWIKLGREPGSKKRSPIPGKAFLPMPMHEYRKFLPALSEVTYANLLKKSEALDNFRRWILMERYMRRGGPGAKPSQVPSETELALTARTGTTVQTLIHDSSSSHEERSSFDQNDRKYSSMTSRRTEKGYSDESEGEITPKKSDSLTLITNTTIDDELEELMKAFRSPQKCKESTPEEIVRLEGGQIRSESILSELFSDPNSFVLTPEAQSITASSRILSSRLGGESLANLSRILGRETDKQMLFAGSPDIDPYEADGYETFVYEYDKMKKVHNYDWKWVDVAIFDYDPETRRYLVRSILAPFVWAWINKIYLCMDGEDPSRHGDRIKDAIVRRIESEYIMRYNLYIDCLPIPKEIDPLFAQLLEIILLKTLSTPRLKHRHRQLRKVQKEITLEWQRTHMRLYFDNIVEKHPKLYRPWVLVNEDKEEVWEVNLPSTDWRNVVQRYEECTTNNFAYKVTRLQKKSVLYKIEPFSALREIIAACWHARSHPFLLTNLQESVSIDEYEQRQTEQLDEVAQYLKNEWMETVLSSIRVHLEKIPKSWYNIDENRWEVFEMSKVSKYLNLIRFMLEDTLAFMVEDSLKNFVEDLGVLTQGCSNIEKGYEWQNDLKVSDFPTPEGHVPPFRLELQMTKSGPKYTQLLGRFPKVMSQIFYNCIDSASGIPDILPLIMKNLLFGAEKNLRSVEKTDENIRHLKQDLIRFMQRGLLPVDVYAQKFKYYLEIWNKDVQTFMKEWEETDHTTKEVKHAVEFHMKHMKELENEIPTTIDITAFRINVETVKSFLVKRKKAIYMAILENFATKLRTQILQIKEDYTDMERKLTTRSDDIEEVMELKLYIESVPQMLLQKEELIQKCLKDYELFEKFKYPISNEDSEQKWSTALSTNRISRITEDASGNLDDDYDRLLKAQQADLSSLSDAVDSATLSVAGLAAFVELEKANEVSQEVKKIWKQVKDLQEHSELLNKRQQIFGLPPAQNEALIRLGKDIEPFKNLWFTAADWMRIHDSIFNFTLDKVDIDAVVKMISEGGKVIRRCIKYFQGADAIQHIAEEIKHQISELKPLVPLIKTLKNTGMRQRHWEAISDITGFTVVAKGNQSFKKLLDQGIDEHVQAIAEIGEIATKEAQIEFSLDKMQKGMHHFKMQVTTDSITGVQIIELPQGVIKLIKGHIQTTEDILQNPFRGPFEETIGLWEKKIKMTKENLENWIKVQDEWVDLQESFQIPDVATKMPNEHKLFLKLERIWRRVMRLVRDMPDVLDIGSDTTLRASILQFSAILARVKTGLAERMKPTNSDSDEDIPVQGNTEENN